MADRENLTTYTHPQQTHLLGLHYAMEYNDAGQPVLRVKNSPSIGGGNDAFGRISVAAPYTLFESQHRYQENEKYWNSTSGGASIAHDANASLVNMNVDTASGSTAITETTKVFPYQPGKSLEIYATFTMSEGQTNLRQRVGYFGTENGVFFEKADGINYIVLRSKSSGSIVETRIPQSEWNFDKFDGTGPSRVTLDTSKSQILAIDIEWLGVGAVRVGFIQGHTLVIAHDFHHANEITGTYMTTAALPIRYEIENTGATAASSTLKHICSTVISGGGAYPGGRSYVAGRGLTYYNLAAAGTFYNLVTIKLNASRLDDIVIPNMVNVLTDSVQNLYFKLVLNATFSTSLTYSTHTNGTVDYSITDAVVTDPGTELLSEFVVNKGTRGNITQEMLQELQLSRRNGTADTLSLIATGDSNNISATGNIAWVEPLRG